MRIGPFRNGVGRNGPTVHRTVLEAKTVPKNRNDNPQARASMIPCTLSVLILRSNPARSALNHTNPETHHPAKLFESTSPIVTATESLPVLHLWSLRQCFACELPLTPSRGGRACPPANDSPCRVERGVDLQRVRSLPCKPIQKSGVPEKGPRLAQVSVSLKVTFWPFLPASLQPLRGPWPPSQEPSLRP
jgi:hypothetical protein